VLRPAAPVLLAAVVFVASYLGPGFATVLNPTGLTGEQVRYLRDYRTLEEGVKVASERYDFAGNSLPGLVLAALCAVAVLFARRSRWPLFAAASAGWLTMGMWPAVAVASYYAATRLRQRAWLGAYAVAAGVAVITPSLIIGAYLSAGPNLQYAVYALILAAVLVGLPMVLGLRVDARREARGGATAYAEGRRRERTARLEQARAQERARIAREMHDVLAHRVSLMVLHAGALEVNAPDERTAAAAALIRTTGREALTDLRAVLGVLRSRDARPDPQPTLADLDRLLAQSRQAGIPLVHRTEGTPRPLPAAVERAAYRIVQEALTNVHKHAEDVATEVVVRYLPGAVEVEVRNAPPVGPAPGVAPALPGSGLGLAGLRERVALLDGQFAATHRADGGFTVLARLPDEAEAVVDAS
jgi:signal transduction histidine kinase